MSPPRLTSTPPRCIAVWAACAARSAARALPVEPRSSSTPAGRNTLCEARSTWTTCQPGTLRARKLTGPRSSVIREKSSLYPAILIAVPTVGSTAPCVTLAAVRAVVTAVANNGLTLMVRPASAFNLLSSLSARKRLYAASTSSRISLTASSAAASS